VKRTSRFDVREGHKIEARNSMDDIEAERIESVVIQDFRTDKEGVTWYFIIVATNHRTLSLEKR
jgi:hypothetical protein